MSIGQPPKVARVKVCGRRPCLRIVRVATTKVRCPLLPTPRSSLRSWLGSKHEGWAKVTKLSVIQVLSTLTSHPPSSASLIVRSRLPLPCTLFHPRTDRNTRTHRWRWCLMTFTGTHSQITVLHDELYTHALTHVAPPSPHNRYTAGNDRTLGTVALPRHPPPTHYPSPCPIWPPATLIYDQ